MLDVFTLAFAGTFAALAKIIIVVVVAFVLVRRDILTQHHITALSRVTVDLFLPCLLFAKVVSTFEPGAMPLWWAIPLAAVLMPLVGLALGALVFATDLRAKTNLLPLASMQNAGYLVLPVGLALFPDRFDTFAVYCSLFILGFNPVLWSVGKLLVSDGSGGWRGLLTPPLVANVVAVLAVLCGASAFIPTTALSAVDLIGQAAVPVATVILGAVLATVRLSRGIAADALRIMLVKYAALPSLVITVLLMLGLEATNPMLARFFVLEASAAPAVGIILQVRAYGGDEETIGALMLVCYLACGLTMPFWLAVWEILA